MPWTVDDVDEFVGGLTDREKRQWVKMANKVYEDCMEEHDDDELCAPRAIRVANANYDQVELEANMERGNKKMLAKVQVQPTPEDIRPDKHNGRDHLVIPVVALREAVVKGQLLPGQEIKRTSQLWDDTPTPVSHPRGASARDRKLVDQRSLGRFYNVHFEDNKLKGEIWVDEEKAISARTENSAKSQELWETYRRLKAGETMDVSTSYWHDTLDESGEYNGKFYDGVQVNIKPDHLAVLPDQTGELSLPDGVGVPLSNVQGVGVDFDKTELQDIRETARTPAYSDTTEGSWSRRSLGEFAGEKGWDEIDSVADLTDAQQTEAAESSLLGSVEATTWEGLTFFQVIDGNGVLYKNALVSVRGGRGSQADIPSDVYDRAAETARSLLEEEFDVEYEENRQNLVQRIINTFRGDSMEKEELVQTLLDRGVDIPEGDLLDTKQTMLEAMEEATAEEDEEEEDETVDAESDTGGPEGEEDDVTDETKTDNSGLAALSDEGDLRELIQGAVREEMNRSEKLSLVDKLDNSKQVDFSRDELEDMPKSALEKVENRVTPSTNYGAAGSMTQGEGPTEVELVNSRKILTAEEGD